MPWGCDRGWFLPGVVKAPEMVLIECQDFVSAGLCGGGEQGVCEVGLLVSVVDERLQDGFLAVQMDSAYLPQVTDGPVHILAAVIMNSADSSGSGRCRATRFSLASRLASCTSTGGAPGRCRLPKTRSEVIGPGMRSTYTRSPSVMKAISSPCLTERRRRIARGTVICPLLVTRALASGTAPVTSLCLSG